MAQLSKSSSRYAQAAILLHWTIAVLLVFQLALGWRLGDFAPGLGRFAAYQLHKSVGITILLLSLARLVIRLAVRRPAPHDGGGLTALLARLTHGLLYVVMIAGPLTGWALVSTARVKLRTMLFGLAPWPSLPLPAAWHGAAETGHTLLAWLLAGLIGLHVAGALRHHLLGDDILARMTPSSFISPRALTMVALTAVAGLGLAGASARLWPFPGSNGAATLAARPAPPAPAKSVPDAPAQQPPPADKPAAATAVPPAGEGPQAASWRVLPGGELGFQIQYAGSAVAGRFHDWTAQIRFSPDDLDRSNIRVTVDLTSADTGLAERDEMLRSPSFFDVAAHPKAVFTATAIRRVSEGAYVGRGMLSLRGAQRPVRVDFQLDIKGDRAEVSGTARIARTAFGVGAGEWADTADLKDAVDVTFRFPARRE